ncbi:MAG: hypothetical protein U1E18_19225 [Brevundimonas sp.]|uniref:hypothetical protein n=1 Tax=Brevundimonas sp. TaxID=1871086 RepID=UPI002ABB6E92|nr:hypothetical protein [Brevundimonas sp.]MDZ4111710.1 hypothetical protein [Brevundimonas sp.]
MASNELTLLRFHGPSPGEIPAISPKQLDAVLTAIEQVYVQVGAVHGFNGSKISWTFALPPRRGCLEFVLAHALRVAAAGTHRIASGLSQEALTLGVDVATLLYTVIFGGRGLVDLYSRGVDQLPEPPQSTAPPLDRLKVTVSAAVLKHKTAPKVLKDLITVCAATGASKVEIVVPDEEPVVIYSTDERRAPSALIRVVNRRGPEAEIRQVASATGPFITGTFKGKPATVFLAKTNMGGPGIVVIWASAQPPPLDGKTRDVQGRSATPQDLLDLHVDDALPLSFEDAAAGVVIVTAAALYS